MSSTTEVGNKWHGLRARFGGWMLASPFRAAFNKATGDGRAQLLSALDLRGDERVVDVGCGSGFFTLEVARRLGSGGRVIGIDGSEGMLAHLERRAAAAGLAQVVQTRRGDVTEPLPLEDEIADAAITTNLLHELPSPAATAKEILRLLKPGGLLVVSDFRDLPLFGGWLRHAHDEGAHGPFTPEAMTAVLREAGFGEVTVDPRGAKVLAQGRRPTTDASG